MTAATLDEIMWSWPTVCRMARDEWTRGFALSIARQAKRRGWEPSPKQFALMRRIVADLYQTRGDFDACDGESLIE